MFIALSRGLVAEIDERDKKKVSKFKWYADKKGSTFYAATHRKKNGDVPVLYLHRLIMGARKGQMIDHINRNGLDNRRANLRFADHVINGRNTKLRVDNKSGYRGVSWDKTHKKWTVHIKIGEKNRTVGYFDSKEKAINKRKEVEKDFFMPLYV